MNGPIVTSIVKWISCKIILIIPQDKLIFVDFTEHMLFFCQLI